MHSLLTIYHAHINYHLILITCFLFYDIHFFDEMRGACKFVYNK